MMYANMRRFTYGELRSYESIICSLMHYTVPLFRLCLLCLFVTPPLSHKSSTKATTPSSLCKPLLLLDCAFPCQSYHFL